MYTKAVAQWIALGSCLLFLISSAFAESDTHYQDIIVGERAAGMGGAFTALADEATGAYYNPAGIIAPESTLIQLSMSAYKLRRKELETANVCGTSLTDDQSSFFGFPGSFGFVHQFKTGSVFHGLGLTIVVPYSDKVSQSFSKENIQCGPFGLGVAGSQFQVDRTIWSGLSYAIKPWRFLQAGLTLGFNVRTVSFYNLSILMPTVQGYSFYPGIDFSDGEANLWSSFLQFGVIAEPTDSLRFGLSITTPYSRLSGSGHLDVVHGETDPTQSSATSLTGLENVEYYWPIPYQIALGAAYSRKKFFTLAADIKIYGNIDPYEIAKHPDLTDAELKQSFLYYRTGVINFNIGSEFYLHPSLALRLGIFTNFSSVPEELKEQNGGRIHAVGFTGGGSFYSSDNSSISFAVQTQIGRGQIAVYRASYEQEMFQENTYAVDSEDFSLIFTVGGSFDIR